jgi:hypothetical protein
MIPEPLALFSIGAVFGLVLCGWPWHPRFSRYSRSNRYRAGAESNGNCVPLPPAPPNAPVKPPAYPIQAPAYHGGPMVSVSESPRVKPQPHGGRLVSSSEPPPSVPRRWWML